MISLDSYKTHTEEWQPILYGMKVVTNPYLVTYIQTRFPRRKKKCRRITKKFRKKYSKAVPDKKVYFLGPEDRPHTLVCHPYIANILKEKLAEVERSKHRHHGKDNILMERQALFGVKDCCG